MGHDLGFFGRLTAPPDIRNFQEIRPRELTPSQIAQEEANVRQRNFVDNFRASGGSTASFDEGAGGRSASGLRLEQRNTELVAVPAIEVFGRGFGSVEIPRGEAEARQILTLQQRNDQKRREDRAKATQRRIEKEEIRATALKEARFGRKLEEQGPQDPTTLETIFGGASDVTRNLAIGVAIVAGVFLINKAT